VRRLIPALLALAAVSADAAAPTAKAKAPPPKERLVCTQDATTGSHIKRRTCMTESERKERQRRDQERVRREQDRTFKTNVEH
jgi:predicted secreted protein